MISLTPIRDSRALTGSDSRKAIRLTLGGAVASVASLRLGNGVWYLEWRGAGVVGRFRVKGGADFVVTLETTRGACVLDHQRCRLVPDAIAHVLEIPEGRRVSE